MKEAARVEANRVVVAEERGWRCGGILDELWGNGFEERSRLRQSRSIGWRILLGVHGEVEPLICSFICS
jgi:hypothetical protein